MRTRCARLARLARGDSADACPPAGGGGGGGVGGTGETASMDEYWVEAGVQEAAAAMEAGRRRALEEEIDRLVSSFRSLQCGSSLVSQGVLLFV